MYLLDTNVVSEVRRPDKGSARVIAWAGSIPHSLQYVSVVTLLELEIGALTLRRKDVLQGDMLWTWIRNVVLPGFAGRILDFDMSTSLRCAPLHVPNRRPDRDAMIAATALERGLTVVTRNVRHFAPLGVPLLNPWEA
jgi:hypothetical protein